MSERVQVLLSIISNLICVVFSVIMVWESIKLVNIYYAINETSLFLHVHIYIVYMALPVGILLFGLEALKEIVFALPLLRSNRK